jgi:hypothetical protein
MNPWLENPVYQKQPAVLLNQVQKPEFEDYGDAITYAIAQEIHQHHELSDNTYHVACQHFGQQGLSELLGLCGCYTSVSMTLNAFKVPLPAGAQYPFEQR